MYDLLQKYVCKSSSVLYVTSLIVLVVFNSCWNVGNVQFNSIVINSRNDWNLLICPMAFKFYCSLIESLESIYPVGVRVDDIQGYSGGSYQFHVRYDLSVSNLTHSVKDLSHCKFKIVRFIVGATWTNPNEYWHCDLINFFLPKWIILFFSYLRCEI